MRKTINDTTDSRADDDVTTADMMDTGGARIIGGEHGNGPGPDLLTANTLKGEKIVNIHGETLGTLADIMLDIPAGRIAYGVMSVGGLLGVGDKLFAVPWTAFTLDADGKQLLLDVSKQALDHAPGFDKDHWPAVADYQWAQDSTGRSSMASR